VARPDLVISQVTGPATANSGDVIPVSWQVTNSGGGRANGSWTDRVVLSLDGTLGNADDVVIATVNRNGPLDIGATYTASADVALPLAPRAPIRCLSLPTTTAR